MTIEDEVEAEELDRTAVEAALQQLDEVDLETARPLPLREGTSQRDLPPRGAPRSAGPSPPTDVHPAAAAPHGSRGLG